MRRTDLLMGRYVSVDPLVTGRGTELVVARTAAGEAVVLLLERAPGALAAERRVLDELAGCGVPAVQADMGDGLDRPALAIRVDPSCVPLERATGLSVAVLRAGLVALLQALARAHGRGYVHGGISPGNVLVCDVGTFTLCGWDAARPVTSAPRVDGFDPVAHDVRLLGGPLATALRRETSAADADSGVETRPRVGAGRDFERVLSRLLAPDARDAYTTAGEVLLDLGGPLTLDPWETVPFVRRGGPFDRVNELTEAWREARRGGSPPPASVDIVGPHGSGRSRLLTELATELRGQGALVLRSGASGCPWGGLRPLVRQLLQITGRAQTSLQKHQAALIAMAEGETAPSDGCVAVSSDALIAVLGAAFVDVDGALLLDDLDEMPAPALEIWRAATRRLAAETERNADGGAMAFVSTSVALPVGHDDTERTTVHLHDWDVATIGRFLDGVLEDAATARSAAPVVRELAGGLPGDIVAVLRDLERSGSLRRVRGRWRFEVALHALVDWNPSDGEAVRRALRAAGRDALTLVEVLSAAGCALDRDQCGRLSELSGHRLWRAGERAESAGLVVRDGASWRLPSERVRRKVLSGLGCARLRSIHRELLAHWVDTRPDDVEMLATHARASHHPDAGALTQSAIEMLQAAGRSDSAIAHLKAAEQQLGEPDWGRCRWLWRADLLRIAGRLAEASELLTRLMDDAAFTGREKTAAAVLLVHVRYESREWEDVLAVALPEEHAEPVDLAEMRYYRAAALTQCFQPDRARREARLAAAEWGPDPEVPRVARARAEHAYKHGFHTGDREAARRGLLTKMRLGRRHGIKASHEFDLLRYGSLSSELAPGGVPRGALAFAQARIEAHPQGLRHLRAALDARLAALHGGDRSPRTYELYISASRWSRATAVERLCRVGIAARIAVRVFSGRYDGRDQARLDDLARAATSTLLTDLVAWSYDYSIALFDLGRQPDLEVVLHRFRDLPNSAARVWLARRAVFRGRLLWTGPADATFTGVPADTQDVVRLATPREPGDWTDAADVSFSDNGGSSPALLAAWEIRRGAESSWDAARMTRWLRYRTAQPGQVALALALGVWRTEQLDAPLWRVVRAVRSVYDGSWFPSLRWQASLFDSRAAWYDGAFRAAQAHHERAREFAAWLRSDRFGEWGRREFEVAAKMLDLARPRVGVGGGIGSRAESRRPEVPTYAVDVPSRLTALLRDRSALLLRAPQLGALLAALRDDLGWSPRSELAGIDATTDRLLVYRPEALAGGELARAAQLALRYAADGLRVLVVSTWSRTDLDGLRPPASTLVSTVAAGDVSLFSDEWRPRARVRNFEAQLRACGCGLSLAHRARVAVAVYAWPEGEPELRRVAEHVALHAAGVVGAEDLRCAGVPRASEGGRADHRILVALRPERWASVSELEASVPGVSRRTLQRRLRALHSAGFVRTTGAARARRYAFVD